MRNITPVGKSNTSSDKKNLLLVVILINVNIYQTKIIYKSCINSLLNRNILNSFYKIYNDNLCTIKYILTNGYDCKTEYILPGRTFSAR